MPTIYEPDILEEFADRLYKQADKLVSHYIVSSAAAGFFLGAIAGVGIGFAKSFIDQSKIVPADVGDTAVPFGVFFAFFVALLGGIVGYVSAKEKAFELRFKAQQTLCQLQIEKNTRRADTVTQGLEPVTI